MPKRILSSHRNSSRSRSGPILRQLARIDIILKNFALSHGIEVILLPIGLDHGANLQ